MKVTDKNCRDPEPDSEPLIRDTDPRIRIRTNMSRIRNIGFGRKNYVGPLTVFSI